MGTISARRAPAAGGRPVTGLAGGCTGRLAGGLVVGIVVTLVAGLVVGLAPALPVPSWPVAASAAAPVPAEAGRLVGMARPPIEPVAHHRGFPDPSVTSWAGGLYAVSTGQRAPGATAPGPAGPWRSAGPALARMPGWATSPDVWASDVVRTRAGWVLYFSATVRGLGDGGRCVGVARSASPLTGFRPVGRRPLVCPRRADTPPAYDRVRHAPDRHGVIDPSGFTARNGRRYLLYKTQGGPSSIRLLRLRPNGTRPVRHARSRELVRRGGVIENPVLVQRGRHFVLFLSEGSFADCGYATTWQRSPRLWGWSRSRPRVLLDRSRSGVCGPGGLDLVSAPGHGTLGFLHGWTCWQTRRACPAGRDLTRPDAARRLAAQRSLYGGRLVWRHGRPRLRFLQPR